MEVKLKSITPNAELNIVEIARVSSTRKDKTEKPEQLLNYLIKNKHWSPFEHSYLTFEIITSKAIGIQLLRHRSFTFQELSQRYAIVDNIESIEFRLQAKKNRQSSTFSIAKLDFNDSTFKLSLEAENFYQVEYNDLLMEIGKNILKAQELYKRAIENGIAKECARMILPMATETKIYMTGSIRSWIHFLEIRDDEHAQKEIQLIAKEIKRIFTSECPIISKSLGWC